MGIVGSTWGQPRFHFVRAVGSLQTPEAAQAPCPASCCPTPPYMHVHTHPVPLSSGATRTKEEERNKNRSGSPTGLTSSPRMRGASNYRGTGQALQALGGQESRQVRADP